MPHARLSCGHTIDLPAGAALGSDVRCPWCEPIEREMQRPNDERNIALDSMQIVYGQAFYDQEARAACTGKRACYGIPF